MSNKTTSSAAGEFIIEQRRKLNLETLAAEINREHHEVGRALKVGFVHAVHAGGLLVLAKSHRKHGSWLEWLEKNFDGSGYGPVHFVQSQAYRHIDSRYNPTKTSEKRRLCQHRHFKNHNSRTR